MVRRGALLGAVKGNGRPSESENLWLNVYYTSSLRVTQMAWRNADHSVSIKLLREKMIF